MRSIETFGERRTRRMAAFEELIRCSSATGAPIPKSRIPEEYSSSDLVLVKMNDDTFAFGSDCDVYEGNLGIILEDTGSRHVIANRLRWLIGYRLESLFASNELPEAMDSDPLVFAYFMFLSTLGEKCV